MIAGRSSSDFRPAPNPPAFISISSSKRTPGVTVLYGPSGSGKTLTLDCIAGFVAPDSGRIMLDNRILFDAESGVNLRPQQRRCGYVFQNYALFPHMTLRENLAFAAHGLPRLERHRRIAEQLERFKLTEHGGPLSARTFRRPETARLHCPRSDRQSPHRAARRAGARPRRGAAHRSLHVDSGAEGRAAGIPVLLVTHDLEECFALAERVLIYDAGRIVHRGSPAELLHNPGTAEVAHLLGGFTIYDAEVIALDPGRQTSRLRLLGEEISGPHLRGCFKGDRVTVCTRPEELLLRTQPGENRIRGELRQVTERPQSIRAEFRQRPDR